MALRTLQIVIFEVGVEMMMIEECSAIQSMIGAMTRAPLNEM